MSTGPLPFLRSNPPPRTTGDTSPEPLSKTSAVINTTPPIETTPVASHPTLPNTTGHTRTSTTSECTTTIMSSPSNTPEPSTSDIVTTSDPGSQPTSPATTTSDVDRTTTTGGDTTTRQEIETTTTDPVVTVTPTTLRVTKTSDTTTEPSLPQTTVVLTTPYTTRYISTVSIVTITTMIPKTTVISGRGTTIYVPGTTTTPTPTVIPDPNQEPPPGTLIDSNHGGGLKTWQLILIVVACLVVAMAIGAVCLVGWLKKRRRRLQQQQKDSMYFMGSDGFASASPGNNSNQFNNSGGCESVQGSDFADSIDRSNRTLIAQTPVGGQQGRWSAWVNRLVRPWGSHRNSYNHQYYSQGHGSPGGLWLIEDGRENPSYEGSVAAAAALYPVSYLNSSSSGIGHHQQQQQPYLPYLATPTGIEDGFFAASAMEPSAPPPQMTEVRHAHSHLQEDILSLNTDVATASPSAMDDSEGNSHYPNPSSSAPLSSPYTSRSVIHPSVGGTYGGDNVATVMSSPNLMRLSVGTSSQAQSRHLSQDQDSLAITSLRGSHDWSRNSGLNDYTGSYRDTISTDPSAARSTIVIDPEQLESNAVFEHIRKDPQGLSGLSTTVANGTADGDEGAGVGTGSGGPGLSASIVGSLRSGKLNRLGSEADQNRK